MWLGALKPEGVAGRASDQNSGGCGSWLDVVRYWILRASGSDLGWMRLVVGCGRSSWAAGCLADRVIWNR